MARTGWIRAHNRSENARDVRVSRFARDRESRTCIRGLKSDPRARQFPCGDFGAGFPCCFRDESLSESRTRWNLASFSEFDFDKACLDSGCKVGNNCGIHQPFSLIVGGKWGLISPCVSNVGLWKNHTEFYTRFHVCHRDSPQVIVPHFLI